MAEEVWVDVGINPAGFGSFLNDLAHAIRGKCSPSDREEDVGGGFFGDELRTLGSKIFSKGFECAATDGDETGFVAFAGDAQEVVVEIESFKPSIADFRESQPGGIEELENGEVALAEGLFGVNGRKEFLDGFRVQSFGKFGSGLWREEGFGGIDFYGVSFHEKTEEDLKMD